MVDPAEPARFLVAGCRPWNRATFARLSELPGTWELATTPEELAAALASGPAPRAVWFLHWSWIVAPEVHREHECVVFHMTDLPYGRGGSPLQHLIAAGHRDTVVSALRMTDELDGGPVYAKAPLSLHGTAEEIYLRADAVIAEMVAAMVEDWPEPVPQEGDAVRFDRRRPDQSAVPTDLADLDAWVDFVRMLDAEGYPHAFIDHGPYRISFRRAARYDGRVELDARVVRREEPA